LVGPDNCQRRKRKWGRPGGARASRAVFLFTEEVFLEDEEAGEDFGEEAEENEGDEGTRGLDAGGEASLALGEEGKEGQDESGETEGDKSKQGNATFNLIEENWAS